MSYFYYTVGGVDVNGTSFLTSDKVICTGFHDSTDESWRRDFSSETNLIVNGDFTDTTITGTGWYESGADSANINSVNGSRVFKVASRPINFRDELLSTCDIIQHSVTVLGNPETVNCDYVCSGGFGDVIATKDKNKFPLNYQSDTFFANQAGVLSYSGSWVSTPEVDGYSYITFSLPSITDFRGVFLDTYEIDSSFMPPLQESYDRSCLDFKVLVSTTGTGLGSAGFSEVYAGTTLNTSPSFVELPSNVAAKYIKIKVKPRSGVIACISRVQVYTKEVIDKGMSCFVTDKKIVADYTITINQDINLTGINKIFYNLSNYHNTTHRYIPEVKVNGSNLDNPPYEANAAFSTNTTTIQNVTTFGRSIDVSQVTGNSTLSYSRRKGPFNSNSTLMSFSNVTTIPPWHSEITSSTRGSVKPFPAKIDIICDTLGVSIIDNESNEVWMKFKIGYNKMIESIPTSVSFKEGILYLGTSRGLLCIDFPSNRARIIDTEGVRERTGIVERNISSYDRWNTLRDFKLSVINGQFSITAFNKLNEIASLPDSNILCVQAYRTLTNTIICIGTSSGLYLHVKSIGSVDAVLLKSKDPSKVGWVKVIGNNVWYTQGEGNTNLNNILDIETSIDMFSPDSSYSSSTSDELNIIDFINQASSEANTQELLSDNNKPTSIYSKNSFKDSNFELNYKQSLTLPSGSYNSGIHLTSSPIGKTIEPKHYNSVGAVVTNKRLQNKPVNSFEHIKGLGPYRFECQPKKAIGISNYFTSGKVDGEIFTFHSKSQQSPVAIPSEEQAPYVLPRLTYSSSFKREDFTFTCLISIKEGFSHISNDWNGSQGVFLGVSSNTGIIPSENRGDVTNTYLIDAGMSYIGNTNIDAGKVYCCASINQLGSIVNVDSTNKINSFATDNIGASSDYREWKAVYSKSNDTIQFFLDGVSVGEKRLSTINSGQDLSVVVGVYHRTSLFGLNPMTVSVKELNLSWHLDQQDSVLGLVETIDGKQSFLLNEVESSEGIYSASYVDYTNDTLPLQNTLVDSDLLTLSFTAVSGTSIGLKTPADSKVDKLYIYDTSINDGWHNNSEKSIKVLSSDDNLIWAQEIGLDLYTCPRVEGKTCITLPSTISGTYFKIVLDGGTYNITGNTPWDVSEIKALKYSTINYTGEEDYTFTKVDNDYFLQNGLVTLSGTTNKSLYTYFVDMSSESAEPFTSTYTNVNGYNTGSSLLGVGSLKSIDLQDIPLDPGLSRISFSTTSGIYVKDHSFVTGTVNDVSYLNTLSEPKWDGSGLNILGDVISKDKGIVFVSNSSCPSPSYKLRKNSNLWHSAQGYSTNYTVSKYGSAPSTHYLKNKNAEIRFLGGSASNYLYITQNSIIQFPMGKWADLYNLDYKSSNYYNGLLRLSYVIDTDKVYCFSKGTDLAQIDYNTGDIELKLESITPSSGVGGFKESMCIYIPNTGKVLYGYNQIFSYDVLNNTTYNNLNKQTGLVIQDDCTLNRGNDLPWNHAYGFMSTCFSDYDNKVYIIGKDSKGFEGKTYFLSYDAKTDYLETISITDEFSDRLEDKSQFPHRASYSGTFGITYCTKDNKLYYIVQRGTSSFLFSYHIPSKVWEQEQTPPFISNRFWPDYEYVGGTTNLIKYNEKLNSLVLTSTSSSYGGNEYTLEIQSVEDSFTLSSDSNSIVSEWYVDCDTEGNNFTKNFAYQPVAPTEYTVTRVGDVTTLSGTSVSFKTTGSIGISNQLFTTTDSLNSNGDFTVGFDFRLPSFSDSIYESTYNRTKYGRPRCLFVARVSDGFGTPYYKNSTSTDPSIKSRQEVVASIGIMSGFMDNTSKPIKAFLKVVDGYDDGNASLESSSFLYYPENGMVGRDNYDDVSSVDLSGAPVQYRKAILSYNYDLDEVVFTIDGVEAGRYTLYRKFNKDAKIHLSLGYSYYSYSDAGKEFVVDVKNIKFNNGSKSYSSLGKSILECTSAGDTLQYRTDTSIVPYKDWVATCSTVVTGDKISNVDYYVATLLCMEDGNKSCELVSYFDSDRKKSVCILTGPKELLSSYNNGILYRWDEVSKGDYRLEKDTALGTINLYLDGSVSPQISTTYLEMPNTYKTRMYYGKITYNYNERIYSNKALTGIWDNYFKLTGFAGFQDPLKMSIDLTPKFALSSQGLSAKAEFTLQEQGEQDVYVFYISSGFDSCVDVPVTVISSGSPISLPSTGALLNIGSTLLETDYLGNADSNSTTLLLNQTRDKFSDKTPDSSSTVKASGWVFLGRYVDPSKVIMTGNCSVSSASVIGFLSVDSVAVNIGEMSKGECILNIKDIKYNIGSTKLHSESSVINNEYIIDATTGDVLFKQSNTSTCDKVTKGDK